RAPGADRLLHPWRPALAAARTSRNGGTTMKLGLATFTTHRWQLNELTLGAAEAMERPSAMDSSAWPRSQAASRQRARGKDTPVIALSNSVHLYARPDTKEQLLVFFTSALGLEARPVPPYVVGSPEPMCAFAFSNGAVLSVEFTNDALADQQAQRGA